MFADEKLAERLQAQHKEFFSRLAPAVQAAGLSGDPYLDLCDSIAFFAGEGSPLTQGNGQFGTDDLDAIQSFYRGRAQAWEAVLTPFAGPEALQRVIDLGGKAEGWENVLCLPLAHRLPDWQTPEQITVVEVPANDMEIWSEISRKGFFGEEPNEVGLTLERVLAGAKHLRRYLALWDGVPAAVASLTPGSGIGFLGGMTTLPEFRGRGLQMALLRRRLEDARSEADLAVIGAGPGTSSHRNAERCGFRIAFAQLSMRVPVN